MAIWQNFFQYVDTFADFIRCGAAESKHNAALLNRTERIAGKRYRGNAFFRRFGNNPVFVNMCGHQANCMEPAAGWLQIYLPGQPLGFFHKRVVALLVELTHGADVRGKHAFVHEFGNDCLGDGRNARQPGFADALEALHESFGDQSKTQSERREKGF